YSIGDTVKFVSKNPYKIIVTGRIKHFTSAFGEHVIAEEVEFAMKKSIEKLGGEVIDFHVAPQVNPPEGGFPYHEWLIEFAQQPTDLKAFAEELDSLMQQKNIYYRDLITGNILKPLVITCLQRDAFKNYMKLQGKLGGQNKTPRLANDRKMADSLMMFKQ
ncbi:MAG: GH3 auxin-responsive promoter family protein, partial [Bacteroidia bacterium]